MLEYADISFMTFIRNLLPASNTVVWAPPSISRQALSNAGIASQQSSQSVPPVTTVGIPGVSVFRTAADRYIDSNPIAQLGLPTGKWLTGPNAGDYNFMQERPTRATYTIVAWSIAQSDLNAIERILAFSNVYKALEITIQGNNMVFPIVSNSDPVYTQNVDTNTGKVLYYGFTKTLKVDTAWTHSTNVPPINEIQTLYKQLTLGDAITAESLAILDDLTTLDEIDLVANRADDTISLLPVGRNLAFNVSKTLVANTLVTINLGHTGITPTSLAITTGSTPICTDNGLGSLSFHAGAYSAFTGNVDYETGFIQLTPNIGFSTITETLTIIAEWN